MIIRPVRKRIGQRTLMEEFTRYVKVTLLRLLSLALMVTGLLLLLGKAEYLSGWLIGCAINGVYCLMLCSRSFRAMKMDPAKSFTVLRGGALMRIRTIVLILIVVLQFPSVRIWAVVAGILTYLVLISFEAAYHDCIRRHL